MTVTPCCISLTKYQKKKKAGAEAILWSAQLASDVGPERPTLKAILKLDAIYNGKHREIPCRIHCYITGLRPLLDIHSFWSFKWMSGFANRASHC
jgi:hypothetical protein